MLGICLIILNDLDTPLFSFILNIGMKEHIYKGNLATCVSVYYYVIYTVAGQRESRQTNRESPKLTIRANFDS